MNPLLLARQILDTARPRARTQAERELVANHTAALAFARSGRVANGVDIACRAIAESEELREMCGREVPAVETRVRKCPGSHGEEHVQTSVGRGPWRCTCKSFKFCADAIRHCKHTRPLTEQDEIAAVYGERGAA